MTTPEKYRQHLALFAGITVVVLIPFLWNFLFLCRAHEMTKFDDIVKKQQHLGAIYGSATNGGYFGYKEALVKTLRPAVLVLGSSRTMQFQSSAFNARFVNAGGSFSNLREGSFFVSRILDTHIPEVVILGLDFWWFNDDYEVANEFSHNLVSETTLTRTKLTAPFKWLQSSRVTIQNYLKVGLGFTPQNPFSTHQRMGLAAIEDSRGFLPDGSYLYTSYFAGESPKFKDQKFAQTIEMVRTGTKRFVHAPRLSETRWSDLVELLALLKDRNVRIVIFLPPIARRVLEEMESKGDQYALIPELKRRLAELSHEFYDFSDPASYGSNDCEFIDGFHAGTVGHHRMLVEILHRNPETALGKYLKLDQIRETIRRYSGNALNPVGSNLFKFNEADFLGLGCLKKPY